MKIKFLQAGIEPIAKWQAIDWSDNWKLFDKIDSYKIDDDYKVKDKDYTLKYLVETEKTNCYDESQINNKTLENETKEVCYDYIQKDWIKFNKAKDLPHKDITIGLFASNLIEGEHIEFIPTIEGFEVLEWASYLVTDIVSYYKLDEEAGSTGTIYDATGTNNGTNVGATNTTGKIKYGYDFDGSDDYIDIGDYIGGKDALSISIWIYPDSTSELQSIIGYYDYCGNDRALDFGIVDGNLRVRTYSSGTTQIGTSLSTSTIPTNAWTHVAWTFDKLINYIFI